jgi:heptosyltransferase-2
VSWDNVLVLQTSFLGDTVLTLPLIAEIRRRFPVKKVAVVCQPAGRELLRNHPAVDELIVDDKKGADRGWKGMRAKAAELKARRFTVAITPHKSLRSAFLLALAGIPCRIGFRQSAGWFLFHYRAARDPRRHDVERNLSVLEPLGARVQDCVRALDLPVNAAVQNAVDDKLRALGVAGDRLIVGVNPGSVWPTKRWSAAGFAELILMLKQKLDCQVLLFGGVEDAAVIEDVQSRCAKAGVNLAGQIDLCEIGAAIGRCAVFVTNDSGPMHIAVARHVPTVAIFCATTPELGFFPYSSNAIVLGRDLSCRPCASHGGRRCPLGHAHCIHEVGADRDFESVRRLLTGEKCRHDSPPVSFQPELVMV